PSHRPPSHTLLPYTTLFRSRAEAAAPPRPRRSEEEEKNNTKSQKNTSSGQRRCTTCTRPDQRKCTTCTKSAETPETRAIRVVLEDRNSTRLNSSHVKISYAV